MRPERVQKGYPIGRMKLLVVIGLFHKERTDAPDLAAVSAGFTIQKLHRNSVVEYLEIDSEPYHLFFLLTEITRNHR